MINLINLVPKNKGGSKLSCLQYYYMHYIYYDSVPHVSFMYIINQKHCLLLWSLNYLWAVDIS